MKENRILLLLSSIFMLVFILACFVYDMIFNHSFTLLSIILYSLYGIGALIFLYYSFSKKNINRGLVFFISIILFMGNIVSGVLGFIYHSKTNTYKKRDLPELNIIHSYKNIVYILVFIISMLLIFVLPLFYKNKILQYVLEGLIVFVLAYVFRDDLKRDFKFFKEYHREYGIYVFKMYFISLAFLFITNMAIRMYTGLNQATNQVDLNSAFSKNPILIIILAVFVAPFMEELLFRGIFRKVFNNKYLFLFTSSIIFGALHVIDDFKTPKELLFIISYSILGFFLGEIYSKTNNLFANMLFHFTQNMIAVLAMILLDIFV